MKLRRWLKIIVPVVSFGLTLMLVETVCRLNKDLPSTWRHLDGDPLTSRLKGGATWCKYTHHRIRPGVAGWRTFTEEDKQDGMGPIWLAYNRQGLRGPEIGSKRGHRILLLGDSFIEANAIPLEKTVGVRLQHYLGSGSFEVLQYGFSSWSPITEFSWFKHFGETLQVDSIYLFVVDNDFYSPEAYSKADAYYRSLLRFNKEGEPLSMPSLTPMMGAFLEQSWFLRTLDTHLWDILWVLKEKTHRIEQLLHESGPLRTKWSRLLSRIRGQSRLYPGDSQAHFQQAAARIRPFTYSKQFYRDNYFHLETLLLRLPEAFWTPELRSSFDGTVQSIEDFSRFTQSRHIRLVVIPVPSALDIDAHEATGGRQKMQLKKGVYWRYPAWQRVLETRLKAKRIPFFPVSDTLRAYKRVHGLGRQNWLYFSNDGHWNANGHEAIAQALARTIKAIDAKRQAP